MDLQEIAEDFRCVLRAYERTLGLDACLRCMDNRWYSYYEQLQVPSRMCLHTSRFCFQHKKRDLTSCKQSCHWLCGNLARDQRLPFVRRCYAGASEIIVPIHREGSLAFILQLGQFRKSNSQPDVLPLWNDMQVNQALRVSRGTQAWLLQVLDQLSQNTIEREPITAFCARNLAQDPELADLARHLNCSSAWAGEQVRRRCGCSWRELKQEQRARNAKTLLMESDLKIAAIARRVGVQDADYFCRWFKKLTGVSPSTWRAQHQLEPEDV